MLSAYAKSSLREAGGWRPANGSVGAVSWSVTVSAEVDSLPRLHLVTDDAVLERPDFRSLTRDLLFEGRARVALHLRGPGLSGRRLWELAVDCASIAEETGALLFINDRVDIALACDAAGVQLGRMAIPVGRARRLLGTRFLIGASIHSPDEAKRAIAEGADFVVAGTLFETPTHPDRPPAGVAWLAGLSNLGVPVIGIGGVSRERVDDVLGGGAYGVAAIRGIWRAPAPVMAVREYLDGME
ncbi:MAG: thiamine phosphate synthase [Gemmatimonas sp.]|nr:thiamine phosphate synthase [Gemmatimonas sp.]